MGTIGGTVAGRIRSRVANVNAANAVNDDILTDGMGVLELDFATQREITRSLHTKSSSSLPALMERMREESLEDCDAFKDLHYTKTSASARRMRTKSLSDLSTSSVGVLE